MMRIIPIPKTTPIINIVLLVPNYLLGLETDYIFEQLLMDKYYVS
jgi:hypothetical protein